MYKGIDHIALAVENIEQAADFYRSVFRLGPVMGLSYPADGVHTNLVLSLGPKNELEFLGPRGNKGFLVDYLKKHGQGVHHLALEVTDIDQETRKLAENSVRIFGTAAEKGMQFTFLHPLATLKVGMQLMQRNPQKPSQDILIKGIRHVAIRVSDKGQGQDFFLNKLGARKIGSKRNTVLDCECDQYVIGEAHFQLLYNFRGSSPSPAAEGLHHVSLKVDDLTGILGHLSNFQIHPLKDWSNKNRIFLPAEKMYGCLWELVQDR
jgi:methylmalonyl-CoA epimerase